MTMARPLLWTIIVLVLLPMPYSSIEATEAVQSPDPQDTRSSHLTTKQDDSPQQKTSQQTPTPSPKAIKLDYQALLSKGEYVDVFENQLSLILAEYWSEDGNWKADSMNDATAYAPRLLFKMYAKTNQEELYRRAITTCNYEKKMLGDVILGKQTLNMHSVFGVYGLLFSMKYAKTEQERATSRQLMELVLALGGRSLLFDTEQSLFPALEGCECISLPFVAFACLEFYEIEPQDAPCWIWPRNLSRSMKSSSMTKRRDCM